MFVMHTGDVAIVGNFYHGNNGIRTSASYHIFIMHADGYSFGWNYPNYNQPPGNGSVLNVDAFSTAGPVYSVGHEQLTDTRTTINLFDYQPTVANGATLLQHRVNQPVDKLFTTVEGFYSSWYQNSTNTIFLEHFDSAARTFDFGKTYTGTSAVQNSFAGMAFFQNFSYMVFNIANSATHGDVVVDRYVTGVCMQSISCPSTVKGGNTLPVIITLNGPAPSGGLVVGLNTSTGYLPMPNNMKAQNFTVPAGANKFTVYLTAKPVAGNTSATLLAIQNGIRRFAVTTITP